MSKLQTTPDSISPTIFSKIVFSGTAFREYHRLDLPLIRTDGNPLGRGMTSMCGDESHMDLRNSSPRSWAVRCWTDHDWGVFHTFMPDFVVDSI